jgi:hypothetical protein
MNQNPAQNLGQIEQAWIGYVRQQRDAIMGNCMLPQNRAATPQEMNAFFQGLDQIESICNDAKAIAVQLDEAGFRAFSAELNALLNDIRGARQAFDQPPSSQQGPLATEMLRLKQEQRDVEVLSTQAAQMVQTSPANAAPLLAAAYTRSEQMFADQERMLKQVPWGPGELAALYEDRLKARVMLLMFQGQAAALLGKFEAAEAFYDRASAEAGERAGPMRLEIDQCRRMLAVMRTQFRGQY